MLASLAGRLAERGRAVVATREPGGTELGNRVRAIFVDPQLAIDPLAEALLVNASRAQHVSEVIEPALGAGQSVLCDRFSAATLAYQGYGRGLDGDLLRTLARIATRGREPDLTLLLDVDVEVSRRRVLSRVRAGGVAADRLEREGAAFHQRVREGYLALAHADPRFTIVDGSQDMAAVLEAAWSALAPRFGA